MLFLWEEEEEEEEEEKSVLFLWEEEIADLWLQDAVEVEIPQAQRGMRLRRKRKNVC